jgi:leader peptidase (prepilin peptidase)/N-methyltransferase
MGLAVVVGNAALFGGLADRFDGSWVLPAYLVVGAALVALSAIDLRHYLLPNRIVFPLAGVTPVLLALGALGDGDVDPFVRALICGAGAFLAFMLLHLASPRSMGFGDVKLSFVLGLVLGWIGYDEVLLGLFLGFFYGAIVGLLLIGLRLRTRRDHVPFGPFLAAGTVTMILAGSVILDVYRP